MFSGYFGVLLDVSGWCLGISRLFPGGFWFFAGVSWLCPGGCWVFPGYFGDFWAFLAVSWLFPGVSG